MLRVNSLAMPPTSLRPPATEVPAGRAHVATPPRASSITPVGVIPRPGRGLGLGLAIESRLRLMAMGLLTQPWPAGFLPC